MAKKDIKYVWTDKREPFWSSIIIHKIFLTDTKFITSIGF